MHRRRPGKIHSKFLFLKEKGNTGKVRKETLFSMREHFRITFVDIPFLKRDRVERKNKKVGCVTWHFTNCKGRGGKMHVWQIADNQCYQCHHPDNVSMPRYTTTAGTSCKGTEGLRGRQKSAANLELISGLILRGMELCHPQGYI